MKLITEQTEEIQVLTEDNSEGGKSYVIEGIFIQADTKNGNGRVYPLGILEREVQRYHSEQIETRRALGELGHPDGPTINLDRASHIIRELRQEGKNFVGKAKIMETPNGKIVKNLIDEGASLGVSTRGMGSLKEKDGFQEVQEDFYLACAADIVSNPSAPDAFVRGVMEGKEWMWDNGVLKECTVDNYRKQIERVPKRKLNEKKVELFRDFVEKLAGIRK